MSRPLCMLLAVVLFGRSLVAQRPPAGVLSGDGDTAHLSLGAAAPGRASDTVRPVGVRRPVGIGRASRLWIVGGGHLFGAVLLEREMVASWGRSNGRFHVKHDWSGDGLMQNDEASHFLWAYVLTREFSRVWAWTGRPRASAQLMGAAETAVLLTLVEFPVDAYNPRQGLGLSDLAFDYAGVATGYLALRHPGRWDFKFSVKRNPLGAGHTLLAESTREFDDYVFWATYRPSLGLGERQPLSVGVGHGVRRGSDGVTPVRELYAGIGTTVPDLVRVLAPRAARYFELLQPLYFAVHLRVTLK
jgi:hypothetical protein